MSNLALADRLYDPTYVHPSEVDCEPEDLCASVEEVWTDEELAEIREWNEYQLWLSEQE
ncbi:MAG: hypothetical protein L0229_00210 [Blastocatellia bacterium]|nr:hypothetical protein [Blastocatellia bacterium]